MIAKYTKILWRRLIKNCYSFCAALAQKSYLSGFDIIMAADNFDLALLFEFCDDLAFAADAPDGEFDVEMRDAVDEFRVRSIAR